MLSFKNVTTINQVITPIKFKNLFVMTIEGITIN